MVDKSENHKKLAFQHLNPREVVAAEPKNKKEFEAIVYGDIEESLEEMAASNQLCVQSYNNKLFVYNSRPSNTGQVCVLTEEGYENRVFYYENGKYYETFADQVSLNKPRPVTDLKLIEKLDDIRKVKP
ncbi:MAG: hypothetical protein HC913_08830 [Microscillaceae bacterium]|nr:hypothetical protein [Microscillaceae bacterium]